MSINSDIGGTNKNKKSINQKNCEKFIFGEGPNEYIMGFYGESTSEGIVKLGCLIGIDKDDSY